MKRWHDYMTALTYARMPDVLDVFRKSGDDWEIEASWEDDRISATVTTYEHPVPEWAVRDCSTRKAVEWIRDYTARWVAVSFMMHMPRNVTWLVGQFRHDVVFYGRIGGVAVVLTLHNCKLQSNPFDARSAI